MKRALSWSPVLWMIFFISGVTGLIYEVVWAKYLGNLLGNTALAHTVVLASFLGGLALGNTFLGRWVDRTQNSLKFYAYLELGICLFAALTPNGIGVLEKFHLYLMSWSSGPLWTLFVRFSCASLLVILPTFLMGGTLPALVRYVTTSVSRLELTLSWFYFINTLGASVGALIAGFYLIPEFGLDRSCLITGALNGFLGVLCLWLSDKQWISLQAVPARELKRVTAAITNRQVVLVLLVAFGSGVVSLCYEIAWIRLLSLCLGSSAYAFSLMLSVFVGGIALGSFFIHQQIFHRLNAYRLLAASQFCIALSIAVTLPVYERLPYYQAVLLNLLQRNPMAFGVYSSFQYLICFVLMLIPTTFMGMSLPLCGRLVTRQLGILGRGLGGVFGLNTLGNVVGSVLAGLFLIRFLGIRSLIESAVLANLILGFLLLSQEVYSKKWYYPAVSISGVLLWLVFRWAIPSWDPVFLTTGAYRSHRGTTEGFENFKKTLVENRTLLRYEDDVSATISVEKNATSLSLRINGKADASTGSDLSTQALSAHIPLLLHPDPKNVLVIGLGSGVTAGTALQHPLENLDLVEISQGVVRSAPFFKDFNYDVLNQPRFHLILEDAKVYLQLTSKKYDVIISEPSNPWIAGVASLYTTDFYNRVYQRLEAHGMMVQWIHTYEMTDDLIELVIRTFSSVFPEFTVWQTIGGDFVLVGTKSSIPLDFKTMQRRLSDPRVASSLKQVGVRHLTTLLATQVLHSDRLKDFLDDEGEINTDRLQILEYEAPKAFFLGKFAGFFRNVDQRYATAPSHPSGSDLILHGFLRHRNSPIQAEELGELHEFYTRFQMPELAQFVLLDWFQQAPQSSQAFDRYAEALLKKAQYVRGLALIHERKARAPQDPQINKWFVRFQLLKAQLEVWMLSRENSMPWIRQLETAIALTRQEDRLGLNQDLAQMCERMGHLDLALEVTERSLKDIDSQIQSKNPSTNRDSLVMMKADNLFRAGDFARKKGLFQESLRYLQRGMELNHGNARVKKLYRRVQQELEQEHPKN